jgi:hypothetical protein
MIRDGILESEAVLSLPAEARWLYVTILLSADDVGLFEATPFKLARRADVRRELADRLVQMLADSDLVRLYQVGEKRYGFIPRFGQRLQIKRIRHAPPPDALLLDEPDTLNKIKHLVSKTTVIHGCTSDAQQRTTAAQPPEPEPEPEPEEEPSLSKVSGNSNVVGEHGEKTAPRKRSADTTAKPKATRIPQDWLLPKSWGEWAVNDLGMAAQSVRLEGDKFADYWRAKPGRDALKLDWLATWRNWCRSAADRAPRRGGQSVAAQTTADRNAALMRMLGVPTDGDGDVIEGGSDGG